MPAGRPSTLTIDPGLQGRIMAYVRAGAFPDRAAVAAGVGERTHYLWQSKGHEERAHREAGKKPRKTWQVYLDYVDELEQAVAHAEMVLLANASKGGDTGTAAMKLLERRFRERWSAKATPAAAAPAAAPAAAVVTPYAAFTERREQRRGKRGN